MAEIVTDNFTRADAATLGANWTDIAGQTSEWSIVSNKAAWVQDGTYCMDIYSGAGWTGGNDQYAEMTINTKVTLSDGGPMVRASATGNGYSMIINDTDNVALGNSMSVTIYKWVSGTPTQLHNGTATVISAGDVVRLAVQGTTLTGYVNGVSKTTITDATFSTGTPGMFGSNNGTSSGFTVSLFAAGDFSGAGGGVTRGPSFALMGVQ